MGNAIRPVAICVFRNAGRILVGHARDAVKGEDFMRPLGGQVEFGERAVDALRREIREELRAEIDSLVLLGVLENLFVYAGEPSHEIVFVFDAKFRDPRLYGQSQIQIFGEDVWLGPATWLCLGDVGSVETPLYPEGLLALLGVNSSGSNAIGSGSSHEAAQQPDAPDERALGLEPPARR